MSSSSAIAETIQELQLPESFNDTVERWYRPIADNVALRVRDKSKLVLGVQGSQGSGKSTLADFLKILLAQEHHLNAAVLSIDDFYLTKAEREALARAVHPLLATRGVPGTHDVSLAIKIIKGLVTLAANETLTIPRFDKACDDRAQESRWDRLEGPVDVVILEGWCVGLSPQSDEQIAPCINELESLEDPDCVWRRYVNERLAGDYQELFDLLELMVVLKAPSFDCVYNWRLLQEQKLIAKLKKSGAQQDQVNRTMSPKEIGRFISHYQRLTEHALATLPAKADWLLWLAEDHSIISLTPKSTA